MNRQNKKEKVDFIGAKRIRSVLVFVLAASFIVGIFVFTMHFANAKMLLCVGAFAVNIALLVAAVVIRKIRPLIIVSILSAIFIISAFALTFYAKPDGICYDPGFATVYVPPCEMHYDYFGFGHREAVK